MSVIGVSKIPIPVKITGVVTRLAKVILGEFEAINFAPKNPHSNYNTKVCYLKLSEKLDALEVIERIKKNTKYGAFIPQVVPDLTPSKKGKIPLKTRLALQIPGDMRADKILIFTHYELLVELQSKFAGLFNLSKKTGHKLMESIARTLIDRLKEVGTANPEKLESGFALSKAYRKRHPHFGDFQLLLSTLHRLQDAAGAPRTQLSESDLLQVNNNPYISNHMPFDALQAACNKYSEKIIKKIQEHIAGLQSDVLPEDSEEEVAAKKVRDALKKTSPYMPQIVKQVVNLHFVPQKCPFQKVRIYGEPFMPPKDTMVHLIQKYNAVHILRSDRIYNLLRLNVPVQQYSKLLELDGTEISGAKLIVRCSDIPLYRVPKHLLADVKVYFGVPSDAPDDYDEVEDDDWKAECKVEDEVEEAI